jgi:hypothetical protein
MRVVMNGKHKADFTLEFKKKNGEITGVLTAPYVEWDTIEDSHVNYRVLTLEGRVLECIEKYFFDEMAPTIPVQGYSSEVEICDIYFKALPPQIYEQMISGTFKIDKNADPKYFLNFLQKEKENKSAIRKFIREQKELGVSVKSKTILYARKPAVPPSSKKELTVVLVDRPSENGKYKIQIHAMPPASGKGNGTFRQKEFDDIYDAKKMFDSVESILDKKHET